MTLANILVLLKDVMQCHIHAKFNAQSFTADEGPFCQPLPLGYLMSNKTQAG